MQILPMTVADYPAFEAECVRQFIEEKRRAHGLTEAEALELSTKTIQTYLPDGLHTKQSYFYTIYDEAGRGGWLWLAVKGTSSESRSLFIYDIHLDPRLRGRGHGRETMKFVEARARELGLPKIELHVFGHNAIARKLYVSEGFVETSVTMEKRL